LLSNHCVEAAGNVFFKQTIDANGFPG